MSKFKINFENNGEVIGVSHLTNIKRKEVSVSETKYCKDCKYFRRSRLVFFLLFPVFWPFYKELLIDSALEGTCKKLYTEKEGIERDREFAISGVKRKIRHLSVNMARGYECGIEGKYFEPKGSR